jgi:hypothetical protein
MNAVLQVDQARIEMLAVLFPRDPIHTGSRPFPQALIRLLQQQHLDRAQQVVESLPFPLSRALSDPHRLRGRALPVLSPGRVS